jgi:hypothetical protein
MKMKLSYYFLALVCIGILSGCNKQSPTIPITSTQPDTTRIETLVNFSLADSNTYQDYIITTNDDALILGMIITYNYSNKHEAFDEKKDKINDNDLKNRLVKLSDVLK